MRVYLPAQVDDLEAVSSAHWEPVHAYAVTDTLRDAAPDLDDDELAELAMDYAAEHSVLRSGSRLRLVIAADYSRADVAFDPTGGPAAVRLTGRLDPRSVACVFVDEPEAAADVAAAQSGSEEALDRLGERHLMWYELGELAHLDLI